MIRLMAAKDIPRASELYSKYMHSSILAECDPSFPRALLTTIAGSKYCLNYVYETNGRISAFICSTVNASFLFRQLAVKNGLRFLYVLLKALIKKPLLFLRLLEMPGYIFKSDIPFAKAEMLFIVVAPKSRHKGKARQLILKTIEGLRELNINMVKVSTLKDNIAVNHLLDSLNFNLIRKFSFLGKNSLLYIFETGKGHI